jgi:hypothetical protein
MFPPGNESTYSQFKFLGGDPGDRKTFVAVFAKIGAKAEKHGESFSL